VGKMKSILTLEHYHNGAVNGRGLKISKYLSTLDVIQHPYDFLKTGLLAHKTFTIHHTIIKYKRLLPFTSN
jgi:hypothetical protein